MGRAARKREAKKRDRERAERPIPSLAPGEVFKTPHQQMVESLRSNPDDGRGPRVDKLVKSRRKRKSFFDEQFRVTSELRQLESEQKRQEGFDSIAQNLGHTISGPAGPANPDTGIQREVKILDLKSRQKDLAAVLKERGQQATGRSTKRAKLFDPEEEGFRKTPRRRTGLLGG